MLSSFHNGRNENETERIRSEHPGEEESCVSNNRVLGAIAVTRGMSSFLSLVSITRRTSYLLHTALGDHAFKFAKPYTTRVFLNSGREFPIQSDITQWIQLNRTPPYLSNVPDVRHVDLLALDGAQAKLLILCSDGLLDLYQGRRNMSRAKTWLEVAGGARRRREENLALRLLRDGLGGHNLHRASEMITVEMTSRWMDDTTILVLPL